MAAFKVPTFQDRVASAAEAKRKALEQLRAKPAIDPAIAAQRLQEREKREAEQAAKREAKKLAAAAEAEARAMAKAEAAAAAAAAAVPAHIKEKRVFQIDPEAAKAARDARYAARKNRK
ncbi:MAG: DUF6481 family protein [Pseudomonadota bacterium]